MRRTQPQASRGSQKWFQLLVNDHPSLLNDMLAPKIGLPSPHAIHWCSPLREDAYAEYRDEAFLARLGVQLNQRPLADFWPAGGPVWDGLATTSRGDLLLVEAKSHIPELKSSCVAVSDASRMRIRASLEETQRYLNAHPTIDWMSGCYQYANRLAHLYLLRALNGLPAWLISMCFVNDHEMRGPSSDAEWRGALTLAHTLLGLGRHRLSPFLIELYIDVTTVG